MKIETEHQKAEVQMKASQGQGPSGEQAVQNEMELVELRSERAVVSLQVKLALDLPWNLPDLIDI